MKNTLFAIIAILISVTITTIPAKAETYEEYCARWLAEQNAKDEKLMDELEAEGTLTQENIDSISKGKSKRKPNAKSPKKTTDNSNTKSNYNSTDYSGYGKGWVYSTDELHIVGLPEDSETGYTKSGWYGNPE